MSSRLCVVLTLATLTGCASIVGDPVQTIAISSTPSSAKVSVLDDSGGEVFSGVTPTQVTLQKSTGDYWGKRSYRVTLSQEGYQPMVVPIQANANGWYLGGNFLFGGLIGWFLVDPFSGNMYTLSPGEIKATLQAAPQSAVSQPAAASQPASAP